MLSKADAGKNFGQAFPLFTIDTVIHFNKEKARRTIVFRAFSLYSYGLNYRIVNDKFPLQVFHSIFSSALRAKTYSENIAMKYLQLLPGQYYRMFFGASRKNIFRKYCYEIPAAASLSVSQDKGQCCSVRRKPKQPPGSFRTAVRFLS